MKVYLKIARFKVILDAVIKVNSKVKALLVILRLAFPEIFSIVRRGVEREKVNMILDLHFQKMNFPYSNTNAI